MTSFPGPCCEKYGISTDLLLSNSATAFPVIPLESFTKEIALELNGVRRKHNIKWEQYYEWVKQLCYPSTLSSLNAIKTSISRLEKKVKEMRRNHKNDQLCELHSKPFFVPQQTQQVVKHKSFPPYQPHCSGTNFDEEVLTMVNRDLATELSVLKKEFDSKHQEIENLTSRLSKLNVRNINKRIKRRDELIEKLRKEVTHKQKAEAKLEEVKKLSKKHQVALCRAKKENETTIKEVHHLNMHAQCLTDKVAELNAALENVEYDHDCLFQRLSELETHMFETKQHHMKYLDRVRKCCIELLSMNVGVNHVEPVIRSVLKNIVSIEVKELPQSTTLIRLFTEMKALSCQQLSEELTKKENLTLHSDGTCKFGQHYYSFQVSASNSVYSLGLAELVSGSASNVLCTFKQILSDVEMVAGSGMGNLILSKIKNTMSDRHVVEKNFNGLLEDYRMEVLPMLTKNWETMTVEEQNSIGTLNNFFVDCTYW